MTDINHIAESRRIAMLIDGDNAQAALIEKMLIEVSRYGTVIIRRVYGDWTEPNMSTWKKTFHDHALQPIQQFRNTVSKNAPDSALIIDAMDLLHQEIANGFCIVSSDSDYTRLATRLRESGRFVIGIGRKQTPTAFQRACDVFVYTENLQFEPVVSPQRSSTGGKKPTPTVAKEDVPPVVSSAKSSTETEKPTPTVAKEDVLKALPLLKQAFEVAVQENGLALLSMVGHALKQANPGFDARTYGYARLGLLIEALPKHFQLVEKGMYVRAVESKSPFGKMAKLKE